MDEEKTTNNEKSIIPKDLIPKDLYSLYMNNLKNMQNEHNFQKYYSQLIFSIDIGKDMLPSSKTELIEEAESILQNIKTYPGNRNVTRSPHANVDEYILTSDDMTGTMRIKGDVPEVLREALKDIETQQKTKKIPNLKKIETKIRKALTKSNTLKVKRTTINDILDKKIKEKYDEGA